MSAFQGKGLALGRLLRVSLAASAVADVICGMAIGGAGRFPSAVTMIAGVAASAGVYHGAMALNDWADAEHDGATRPERPIPSGSIPRDVAFAIGMVLVLLGVVAGAVASPAHWPWMLAVACCAVGYDLVGRGPVRGPLLLGLCRAGNLGFGMAIAGGLEQPGTGLWAMPAIYFLYVVCVSLGGRLEDGESSANVAVLGPATLGAAGVLLAATPAIASAFGTVSAPGGPFLAWPLALAAAYGLVRRAMAIREARQVGPVMGVALRRLLILTAVFALMAGGPGPAGWWAAALALAGFPLSHALRRAFPPS